MASWPKGTTPRISCRHLASPLASTSSSALRVPGILFGYDCLQLVVAKFLSMQNYTDPTRTFDETYTDSRSSIHVF
jgi:hypothetical protein